MRLDSLGDKCSLTSKSFSFPAIETGQSWISKSTVWIPLMPFKHAFQDFLTELPNGESAPRPVMTTRLSKCMEVV